MDPLVSILIPAYNAEKWIRETIKSALMQCWPQKEIIVVDDGSSDNTWKIIRSYESSLLKGVKQDNLGGPAARNRALSIAQGDFIQWLDHDDLLAPDKIFHQLKSQKYNGKSKTLLSSAFGTFYYRKEKAKFARNPLWKNMDPVEFFIIKFSENAFFQSSAWLVSRKLTEMAGPWWELRSPDDDGEYFSRVVAASERIEFVPEARSYWRVGNYGSMSQKKSHEAVEALFYSLCKSFDHLRAIEDSERTRTACLKYLQTRFHNFYPEEPDIVKRAHNLSRELGGILVLPRLKWKYLLIRILFGGKAAKHMSATLPRYKTAVYKGWDWVNFKLFANNWDFFGWGKE